MVGGQPLMTSVETAMHAVLPHAVVVHVHSVNTLAWAVRLDAAERLEERLRGLRWQWIPSRRIGLATCAGDSESNGDRARYRLGYLFWGNHGLVVCGADLRVPRAWRRLDDPETRLARVPRPAPAADVDSLMRLSRGTRWKPLTERSGSCIGHGSVLEPAYSEWRRYLSLPGYFPCPDNSGPGRVRKWMDANRLDMVVPFRRQHRSIVCEGGGLLVDEKITPSAEATLSGLAQVLRRIEETARLRYLTGAGSDRLLTEDKLSLSRSGGSQQCLPCVRHQRATL